ncbi:GntR family transcriptional regulator [Herbaspirillum sp. NPDC087042]|uniref:GntR family transcriptional regulator n=1 Tax=Herbaspirillum sp. NPDC087042 TaxID=3364004 RepID=UPI003827F58E
MSEENRNAFFKAAEQPDRPALQRRPSLGEEIYETLLAQLISLKIAPGNRIAVDALVRELGVSQTPIRAALIRLETEGLVVKTHNVGYSAAPMPSRQHFEQIYDLRLLLEPYAARRTAENLSDEVRDQLEGLDRAMSDPGSEDAKRAYSQFALLDARFHNLIATASGNTLVAEALARSYAHMHLFRLRYHSVVTEGAVEEHALILRAIIDGDGLAAHQAMEAHLVRSLERWRPFFDAGIGG